MGIKSSKNSFAKPTPFQIFARTVLKNFQFAQVIQFISREKEKMRKLVTDQKKAKS